MKVYFISGLGADRRVFRHIKLPSHFEAVYLDWIQPEKTESLSHYALRLAERIDKNEKFALIGLSFGGMLAVEISKRIQPEVLILISTVTCYKQLPFWYKLAGKLKLHKIIPVSLFLNASILKRVFTTETKEDKKILKEMIRNCDHHFIRWAFGAVLSWDNAIENIPCVHIHGTGDGILPHRFTRPTHLIKKGGHLMILNRADEINKILAEVFSQEAIAS